MAIPITNDDVDAVLRRYERACNHLGMIPQGRRLILSKGSKTNGIAFRIALVSTVPGESHGHHHPPAGYDFLGMTKRAAFDTLADRSAVLEDVARHLEEVGR